MKMLNNFVKNSLNKDFYKLAILRGICASHGFCSDCPYCLENIDTRGHCRVTDYMTRRYGKDCTSASPANMNFDGLVELLDLKKDAPSVEELEAMDEDIIKMALEVEIPDR